MPERTGYAHGVPSWVDLATTDTDSAKQFYGALFGWNAMDVPAPGSRTYAMFMKNGKVVAGMGELTTEELEAGTPPVWSTYVNVNDLDATVEKVTAAGGAVVVPTMDVMDTGRMAFIADPTGAMVGLWEPGTHTGAQLVNEHGALSWNELITDDTAAATAFYEQALGWRPEVTEMPGGPYTSFWVDGNVEGNAAAGMMGKTDDMGAMPNVWGVYFYVDDVDAALATVSANGGQVVMPPMDVPEVGRMAGISDPQGAMMTVIKLVSEQK